MTVLEVQAEFPNARPAPEEQTLGNGARGILEIPNVNVAGRTFTAQFYFLDERLTQVTLSMRNPGPFSLAHVHYAMVLDAVRAEYGKKRSLEDDPATQIRQANWLAGRTNIMLVLLGIGEHESVLNIVYQGRLAQEADKFLGDLKERVGLSQERKDISGEQDASSFGHAATRPLGEVLGELNQLIGLSGVKKALEQLVNFLRVQRVRADRGLKQNEMSLHAVFKVDRLVNMPGMMDIIRRRY